MIFSDFSEFSLGSFFEDKLRAIFLVSFSENLSAPISARISRACCKARSAVFPQVYYSIDHENIKT